MITYFTGKRAHEISTLDYIMHVRKREYYLRADCMYVCVCVYKRSWCTRTQNLNSLYIHHTRHKMKTRSSIAEQVVTMRSEATPLLLLHYYWRAHIYWSDSNERRALGTVLGKQEKGSECVLGIDRRAAISLSCSRMFPLFTVYLFGCLRHGGEQD